MMKQEVLNKEKMVNELFEYIATHWIEIVKYAYSRSTIDNNKKINLINGARSMRPSLSHIHAIVSEKYPNMDKKELRSYLVELLDYERMIVVSAHYRLGRKGIEMLIRHYAELGKCDYEEAMARVSEDNVIFEKTPEELKKYFEEKKKRRRNKAEKSGENKKIAKKGKDGKIAPKKKEKREQTKPPTDEKPKKETENKSEIVKEIKRPPIKDESGNEIRGDPLIKVKKKKVEGKKVQSIQKIGDIIDEIEEKPIIKSIGASKSEKTEKGERISEEMRAEILNELRSLQPDDEYLYLIGVLMKIKKQNGGVPLKEEQILEKAMEIDADFAKKFFVRMFRITPLYEILKIKPTGYMF